MNTSPTARRLLADAPLIASLLNLPPGEEPVNSGPLCADWYDAQPGPDGCGHLTCYGIAYRDAPPHACAIEADHDDPISQEYGMYLATCQVCDLWQALSERRLAERTWEAATERGNR